MSWKIKAKIDGADKLHDVMRQLPAQIARRALRPSLNKEGSRVVAEARRRSPIGVSGLLKKSYGKKTRTYVKTNSVLVIVGPRRGFREVIKGKPHDPSKIGHLVEFGTKPHWIGRKKFGAKYVFSRRSSNYVPRMHPGAKPALTLTSASRQALVGAYTRLRSNIAAEIEKMISKGKYTPETSSEGDDNA